MKLMLFKVLTAYKLYCRHQPQIYELKLETTNYSRRIFLQNMILNKLIGDKGKGNYLLHLLQKSAIKDHSQDSAFPFLHLGGGVSAT
jgi:hypothetical protein